jgi:hypothetical protein
MLHPILCRLACLAFAVVLSACGVNNEVLPTTANSSKANILKAASDPKSSIQSSARFIRLTSDSRISYQAGTKELALSVKRIIDQKAAVIAKRQYSPFSKIINVSVLNSEKTAKRFCRSARVRGCVVNQRLFITKRAIGTLSGTILHELSHLHFEQKLGMFRYHSAIPAWFQEGLAVVVSDGGAAEKVTFESVIRALRSDKSITPGDRRSLLFPKKAEQFGIRNSMFYAQSGIFVKYLQVRDPLKFKGLILRLSRGERFASAVSLSYQNKLAQLWAEFKIEIATKSIGWLKRYDFK